MLGEKTALVLGAGSSKQFGFPLGSELVQRIVDIAEFGFDGGERTKSTPQFHRLVERSFGPRLKLGPYYEAGSRLAQRLWGSRSIDDFLGVNVDDEQLVAMAKLAIVHIIAKCERDSELARLGQLRADGNTRRLLDGTWPHTFFQILRSRVPKADLDRLFDDLTVISFCYDRCFEHISDARSSEGLRSRSGRRSQPRRTAQLVQAIWGLGSAPERPGRPTQGRRVWTGR